MWIVLYFRYKVMCIVLYFRYNMMRNSVVVFPKTHNPKCTDEKSIRQMPTGGAPYGTRDQCSSNPSRSSKPRKPNNV